MTGAEISSVAGLRRKVKEEVLWLGAFNPPPGGFLEKSTSDFHEENDDQKQVIQKNGGLSARIRNR